MVAVQSLHDQVVVVTGAARGIGAAVCRELNRIGARVVGVDCDGSIWEESHGNSSEHPRTLFVEADVSTVEGVAKYVEFTLSRLSRIDGLVNNAGIEGVITSIIDYPTEVFDRVVAVNLRGVFLGLKHVLPVMIKQREGAIVNVASVAGVIGHADHAAYVASKHAVVGLTRVAAAEVARYGVRVNALCPGPTSTRMITSIEEQVGAGAPAEAHQQILAKIPAARYGEPIEIARAAAFLLGDQASYVNGAALVVDGAFTSAM